MKRQVNGKPLIYLDNAATSQKPKAVIEVIDNYYRQYNANIHRGIHKLAEEATQPHEMARGKVAEFINARHTEEVIFVRNATEAINLVAYTWGRANIAKGDKIVLTIMEHVSNIVPWQLLAQEKNAEIEFIKIDKNGLLRQDEIRQFNNRHSVDLPAPAGPVTTIVSPLLTLKSILLRACSFACSYLKLKS